MNRYYRYDDYDHYDYYREFEECYGDYSDKSILIRVNCMIYGILKIIMGIFMTVTIIMVMPQVIRQLM
jgi:hypothetical protein